jgi:hypothetical protein
VKIIKNGKTAHNRSVYASGAVAPSGYEKPQSAYGLCAVFIRHIFAAAETATQFLYRSRKNVVNSRNVRRNKTRNLLENKDKCCQKYL